MRYCFQADHGTGKTVEYITTLNKLSSSSLGNGFSQASQNSMQFGGLNVRAMVLRRLTFTVATSSNMTIGGVELDIGSGASLNPANVNMTPTSCNSLFTCPETEVLK